ncbi:unnamed protein product, partial [Mesorhabditis belari]|uniref:Attractin n=1 Tax=Mesorhabditis belari TaxID=2138241 RepID=A0AAF3EH97_9BILA
MSGVQAHSEARFDVEKVLTHTCNGCFKGPCVEGKCVCFPGWSGDQCDQCYGRIKITNQSTEILDGPKSYQSLQRCTWIIEHDGASLPTTFQFKSLHTECGWDFVYLYDGNGIYNQQLGALCGRLKEPIEMMAPSGSAVLYFVSDMAANYPGFNISFDFDRCPYNCSGQGTCKPKLGCVCNPGFTGPYCQIAYCDEKQLKDPCLNGGVCQNDACNCTSNWHGLYCQQSKLLPVSDPVIIKGDPLPGRASHASIADGSSQNLLDIIWTVGGYSFSGVKQDMIVTFNVTTRNWITIQLNASSPEPENRYDHTIVKLKNTLYMFGGVKNGREVTNEFWAFDMEHRIWKLISDGNHTDLERAPLAVAGHTAYVVGQKMYIVFGYNPFIGYVHYVQIYDFETKTWNMTTEHKVHGRFGHSMVVVDETGASPYALIYGGTTKSSNNTDDLIKFDIKADTMAKVTSTGTFYFPLTLHRAVLLNHMMIITGGNKGNGGTSDECFNDQILVYDTACGQWIQPDSKWSNISELARYGHSAVIAGKDPHLFVIGGFNGTMRENIYEFKPADCSSTNRPEDCQKITGGLRCVYVDSKCQKFDNQRSFKQNFISMIKNEITGRVTCPETRQKTLSSCEDQNDCVACTSQNGCGWCSAGNQCLPSDQECLDAQSMLTTWEKCGSSTPASPRSCSMAANCYACKLLPHCNWYMDSLRPQCITVEEEVFLLNERKEQEFERVTAGAQGANIIPRSHFSFLAPIPRIPNVTLCAVAGQAACEMANNCSDCMDETKRTGCMWCPSTERCINQDAYTIAFAYGQCQSWVNQSNKCQKESAICEDHKTCQECQTQPGCGWIDDGSETGLGECVQGSSDGPQNKTLSSPEKWFFTDCPDCQCNGHSKCLKPTNEFAKLECGECANNTSGDHCQSCSRGFFGDARNGGTCQLCECNGQADDCDNQSGACYCTTKGVVGEHCDRCDAKYIGNITSGEICKYELAVDFIFTFKLKNDNSDKHVDEIFLFSVPYKRDTDVTFQISCEGEGAPALVALNLTSNVYDGNFGLGHTKQMMVHTTCDSKGLRRVYLANDPGYAFGTEANTTFYVRVSNFTTPIVIQVSFAQSPPINWVLFFVIFAACFIVLLVVAGLLWMIKLRIEVYRRNQNRINEIEHMASRPFSSVRLELTNPYTNLVATPISIEPCSGYKAGVYTLAVRLPTGGRQTTPNGTSGLAVASALCLLTPSQLGLLTAPDNTENRNNRKRTFRSYIPFLRNPNNSPM